MEIRITVAKRPTNDYPFAVIVGKDGQENLCRSLRDCLIAAGGAHLALIACRVAGSRIVWDERLSHEWNGK
jgi:hypothetical protein